MCRLPATAEPPQWQPAERAFYPGADEPVDLEHGIDPDGTDGEPENDGDGEAENTEDDSTDDHEALWEMLGVPGLPDPLPDGLPAEPWLRRMYSEVATLGALDVLENNEEFGAANNNDEPGWKGPSVALFPFSTSFGFVERCNGWTIARGTRLRHAETQRRVKRLVSVCRGSPHVTGLYGSGELLNLSAMVLNELGETSRSAKGLVLPRDERHALGTIYTPPSVTGARPDAVLGERYCDSVLVMCSIIEGKLQVTGLRLVPVAPRTARNTLCGGQGNSSDPLVSAATDHPDFRAAVEFNPVGLPDVTAMKALVALRTLVFFPLAVVTGVVSAQQACAFLQQLPALEVLVLGRPLPPDCALPGLRSLQFLGGPHAVHGEDIPKARLATWGDVDLNEASDADAGNAAHTAPNVEIPAAVKGDPSEDNDETTPRAIVRSVRVVADTSIEPSELAFACHSPELRMFICGRNTGFPACMGSNTELRRVDVRGSRLRNNPLPLMLAGWTKLVDFVAFEQSFHSVAPNVTPSSGCKQPWSFKTEISEREFGEVAAEDEPWHCPDTGLTLQFDDSSQPFWSWRSIERFWVDVNFFYGSVPAWLPEKWPLLRTLDLYSNELTGQIPATLCGLTQLDLLQLHDNHLEGVVPFDAFFGRGCPNGDEGRPRHRLRTLTLALNPELTGCVSIEELREQPFLVGSIQVRFTEIRVVQTRVECVDRADHTEL